jgi:hypothetical protein
LEGPLVFRAFEFLSPEEISENARGRINPEGTFRAADGHPLGFPKVLQIAPGAAYRWKTECPGQDSSMGSRPASELDDSGNRESTERLGESRRELFANQDRGIRESLLGQNRFPFLIDQVAQNGSFDFPKVRCAGPEVGIIGFFLVSSVV